VVQHTVRPVPIAAARWPLQGMECE